MDHCFPKAKRLLTRSDYQTVFDAPEKRSSDRYFTVLGHSHFCMEQSRLGLVVAKRHILRAHERNRVKRLIRESFRRNMFISEGIDVVVIAKNAAQYTDNANLVLSLERHWLRLKS